MNASTPISEMTTSELVAVNARIGDRLDTLARSPLLRRNMLRVRREVRAELEGRKAAQSK